jgi:hypothetical protein
MSEYNTGSHLREELGSRSGGPERIESFERKYQKFVSEMRSVIDRFFPNELKTFNQPSLERQYNKFVEIANPDAASSTERKKIFLQQLSDTQISALMGETAIRYLDDFIDNSLWPRIRTYEKESLRIQFTKFCDASVEVIRNYVPDYPSEIKELFLLELDLELEPTQKNFEAKIILLFNRKSLNLRYMESLMRNMVLDASFTTEQESQLSYKALCIRDFSRDFEPDNYLDETDFNLRNYIHSHHLKPDILIAYIQQVENELLHHLDSGDYTQVQAMADAMVCQRVIGKLQHIENV